MTRRRDDQEPFGPFAFNEWLRDGAEEFFSQVTGKDVTIDTTEFETHMRKAAKSQLLAVRSLVDTCIDIFDVEDEAKAAETTSTETTSAETTTSAGQVDPVTS